MLSPDLYIGCRDYGYGDNKMRKHIKIDSVKMFAEDLIKLEKAKVILGVCTSSDVHRLALDVVIEYADLIKKSGNKDAMQQFHVLAQAIDRNTEALKENTQSNNDIFFINKELYIAGIKE